MFPPQFSAGPRPEFDFPGFDAPAIIFKDPKDPRRDAQVFAETENEEMTLEDRALAQGDTTVTDALPKGDCVDSMTNH